MASNCETQELIETGKNEHVSPKAAHGIKQLRKNFSLEAMRDDDIALIFDLPSFNCSIPLTVYRNCQNPT